MWEQRFFTDGTLAPCWGYQIDETASVIYGIYDHYTRTKEKKFLKDNLKMLENAVKFLETYTNDILEEKENFKISYDLWEMHEGVGTYSLASIYAAYKAMINIYDILEEDLSQNKLKQREILKKGLEDIKKYISKNLYDEEKKCFLRNREDKRIDISILGLITPFEVFSLNDKKIQNMIEIINLTLRTYTRRISKV